MNKKSKKFRVDNRNLQYFRTLGLPHGECRIDVIRRAAIQCARSTVSRSQPAIVDFHRARVAHAAYRLLDPRNRIALYERVQLSCPVDEEEIHQPVCVSTSNLNRSIATDRQAQPTSSFRMMDGEVVDRAIDGTASESLEDSSITSSYSHLSLHEKRQIVRLVRESESTEAALRGLSPLGWLRSYLKI